MKWASAISDASDWVEALERCAEAVGGELGREAPASLAVVFASAGYTQPLDPLPQLLRARFPGALLLGCSAAGVIGDGQEIEDRPALSLIAGHLPGVRATGFHVAPDDLPTPDDPPDAWKRLVGVAAEDQPHFLLLMDPFSAPGRELLAGLDFAFPAAGKVGGLASGGRRPGSHALFLGDRTYREGAVGVALSGDIAVDTLVAQGCRAIGEPKVITKCRQHLLLELDGEPPLAYLRELYPRLDPRDQELVHTNLFLGIAVDPLLAASDVDPSDFLIRNLIGVDQERGILAIGEYLREGQLVQFHVRDAETSAEDLQRQLSRYAGSSGGGSPAGALLFQCNGRGFHLYGKPNHDAALFQSRIGSVPLGGFFCNGEIGPVGRTTYLHGYTSSFALFRGPARSGRKP